MFRIADGRDCFYQWDLDRQIIVEDDSITEVHFCNRTDNCSLVVEVEELEIFADAKPISVLRTANVPNIILQNSFDIRVFGYDGKATLHEKTFKVKPRTQPSDYVYTETTIKSITEILEAAEQVEAITTDFYEFVDEYRMGLTDDGEGNVELKAIEKEDAPDIDLDNYYTKSETEALIEEAVEGIEIPEGDSTEGVYHLVFPEAKYAAITDEKTIEYLELIKAGGYACAYMVGYAVNSYEANGAKYLIEYVEKDSLGSGYYLYTGMGIKSSGDTSLRGLHYYIIYVYKDYSGVWTKSYISEQTNNVTTAAYVSNAVSKKQDTLVSGTNIKTINGASILGEGDLVVSGGGSADLSNYYTKEETDNLIPSTEGLATKAYVDGLFEGIATAEGGSY